MLIQYLVYPKSSFDANNKPKDLNLYESKSEVKRAIHTTRLRQYIEREARPASNMNKIYGIIWVQCTPEIHFVSKGNRDYPTKSKFSIHYVSCERQIILPLVLMSN